jgi:hypothetical protein
MIFCETDLNGAGQEQTFKEEVDYRKLQKWKGYTPT